MSTTYKDNSKEVLAALKRAKKRGLESIGITAEGYAKEVLTKEVYTGNKPYPITGRLRNSITWAISGEKAKISSYKGDNGEEGGTYDGTAPDDGDDAVYIGTNVVYGPGIELGTHRKAGAVHFLQGAATEHTDEYKKLLEDSMKNA